MVTKLRNVMVEMGPTSEVVDLVVDEHGLTVGAYGQMVWKGLDLAIEAGPAMCTIRVVTSTGSKALFFVPGNTFGGDLSPQSFARWLEEEAVRAGARVDPVASVFA